jgi:hypothetical protein
VEWGSKEGQVSGARSANASEVLQTWFRRRRIRRHLLFLAVAILRSGCPTQGQGSCTGSLQHCGIFRLLWRTPRQAERLSRSARPWRCLLDCGTHLAELMSRFLALQALRYVWRRRYFHCPTVSKILRSDIVDPALQDMMDQ